MSDLISLLCCDVSRNGEHITGTEILNFFLEEITDLFQYSSSAGIMPLGLDHHFNSVIHAYLPIGYFDFFTYSEIYTRIVVFST